MIIFGFRTFVVQLGIVQSACSAAGHEVAWRIVRARRVFTLFFIPVIPYRTQYIATCTYCGSVEVIDKELMQRAIDHAQTQRAIPQAPPPNRHDACKHCRRTQRNGGPISP
jgi:hypothetical protein